MQLVSASASPTNIALWGDLGTTRDYSQLNGTFPGAHTQNQAKVNMLAAVRNILVAKLLDDFEKLLEVEILCTSHNVNHVVEFVRFILPWMLVSPF